MPIDAGIYNVLNTKAPEQVANAFSFTPMDGAMKGMIAKNKLAELAQEQQLQGFKIEDAQAKSVYNKYIQHAIQDSGGDIGKMRDAALASGHPEGIAFAQHLDKVLQDRKEAAKLQQFADTVKSIGQPTVQSNQTSLLAQGSTVQPSYSSVPETSDQRQQKMLTMLSLNPEAGKHVADVLNKPEEFRMKQDEARQARQDTFAQQENMARLVAGLRPPKEDNTLVAVIGPDGVTPTLVPRSQAAGMRPASGVNPDKPLTDSQSKALLFGSRMKASDDIIKTLEKEGTTTSVPGSRAPLIGGAVNYFSSANQQNLDQAKRDFINAVLRRESGAVISPSEFDNGEKQYFPQIGDSAAVTKQKANNRNLAMRGVLVEVPEKHRNELFKDQNQPSTGNPHANKTDAQIKAELGL